MLAAGEVESPRSIRVAEQTAMALHRTGRFVQPISAVAGAFEPIPSVRLLLSALQRPVCWRITRHNALAALADLYPQWLVRDLLPLPPNGGIPREATRSLSPPSSADAAGRSLWRSKIAIKAAVVADLENSNRTIAKIAKRGEELILEDLPLILPRTDLGLPAGL